MKNIFLKTIAATLGVATGLVTLVSCGTETSGIVSDKPCFGGVYPHLAYYNDEGECGTGAVVPWAGRLWVITYGPHLPYGSSDKLYEIDDSLHLTIRPESTGGTPANRMIHRESNQLFIGPYVIDGERNVRVISYKNAQGRYTGTARHLTDPVNKLYTATMEEGFYEVDVHTLNIKTLYPDANDTRPHDNTGVNPPNNLLPGAHGKGLYSGQGVLVYSNNGEATHEALEKFDVEAGSLSEWNGRDWKVVRRNQFTEITGPGGIYGNSDPATDPIWSLGWDYKSILLAVRDNREWHFYRLPKASNSYDGAHGWNTEWPRIRDVGTKDVPEYLMTMHGMFWHFPETFTASNTAGIHPRSAYLKVIGDFARWHDRLVFGCDDSARKEFLNKRRIKGGVGGPGQSNSNLWFTSPERPDSLGPTTAGGSVWLRESIEAGSISEPFLFAGWEKRGAWLRNDGEERVVFSFEVDPDGYGSWSELHSAVLEPGASSFVAFAPEDKGVWIRVKADNGTVASVSFVYASRDMRSVSADPIFRGLASVEECPTSEGLLYGRGGNVRTLAMLARNMSGKEQYYELSGNMCLAPGNSAAAEELIRERYTIPTNVLEIDEGSVLIVDDKDRRWRLPLGDRSFDSLTLGGKLRICREVATERDLFNCHGTFYELPAENADGFAKIRPISSHRFRINDYASYRGLLIMTGISNDKVKDNPRIIRSEDGSVAVWAGVIDDLWKLGKPIGSGGPWVDANVEAGKASDPYLIGFYDERVLNISHKSKNDVCFTIEVDPTGDGTWMEYGRFVVGPGQAFTHRFPDAFQARWIRFRSDRNCVVTTWLEYK